MELHQNRTKNLKKPNLLILTAGLLFFILGAGFIQQSDAQGFSTQEFNTSETGGTNVSPGGALLRSFVLPGWGHYAIDSSDWSRGQWHLGADVALLASYLLVNNRINQLEGNLATFGDQYSGINLSDRDRGFRLAASDHMSLSEYNDFQERTRNWDQLYEETEENYWEWESEDKKQQYNDMRSSRDDLERQAPAILGMMVVNRVIAGVNAFSAARERGQNISMYLSPAEMNTQSVQATFRYDF